MKPNFKKIDLKAVAAAGHHTERGTLIDHMPEWITAERIPVKSIFTSEERAFFHIAKFIFISGNRLKTEVCPNDSIFYDANC